jgi:hypothetical protein
MGLWDKLREARDYVRNRRGPDSYFQYERKRDDERKAAEQGRERAKDYAEKERGEEERGRDYEERYTAGRESDITRERTQRPKDPEPDP